jgi:hypothetical protein
MILYEELTLLAKVPEENSAKSHTVMVIVLLYGSERTITKQEISRMEMAET